MAVWGYLYNSRSVGLMHTLPVDRTGLFVTNTLSGLAMMLIPYAVVGAFSCLIALFWGAVTLASGIPSRASRRYRGTMDPARAAPPHRGQKRVRFFRNRVRLKNDLFDSILLTSQLTTWAS